MHRSFFIFLLVGIFPILVYSQNVVKMQKFGGVFILPCEVNGLNLKFIFDTGASDVSISVTEALFMLKNGYLSESDLRGSSYYQLANGKIMEGTKINLRNLKIGNKTIYDVDASVTHSMDAALLLGQSALSKLGRFTMDYSNNTLTFLDGQVSSSPAISPSTSSNQNLDRSATYTLIPTIDPFAGSMVLVKGGEFIMGCTKEQESDCDADEMPARLASLNSYYIGKYEVTQKQWEDIMGYNPSHFKGCDQCPVDQVSWDAAQEFVRKLNAMTKKKYRLPTETEWEYAAKGGNLSRKYKYAGSNNIDEVAWHSENSGKRTQAVGMKKPNELGLFDMSGNVEEWCQDMYGAYGTELNTKDKYYGNYISRGGSWFFIPLLHRVTKRFWGSPQFGGRGNGLRLARNL